MEEEDSYLDISDSGRGKISDEDEMWCRINELGELDYVNWDFVLKLSQKYDSVPGQERTQEMIIAKLMGLVRKKYDHSWDSD